MKPLWWYGPTFEAEIHSNEHSFLATKNNGNGGLYANVKLLVDTGSNISGLDNKIITQLHLPIYDLPARVDGVGGFHNMNMYRCVLFLDIFGNKGLPLDVVSGNYEHSPYDGIIGRDVLQFCTFTFDGPGNCFVLEAGNF